MSSSAAPPKGAARVRYEKEVTIEDVIAEANAIYQKCKKLWPRDASNNVDAADTAAYAKIHDDMITEHPQFAATYPIVLRYLCELREYRQKALRRYLNYLKHHPWTSEDSFFESQAMYVTLLYKETHPRYDQREAKNLFDNTVRLLKLERDAFKQQVETNKKEIGEAHRRMMKKNTLELKEWFALHGKAAADVPVCAVVADESGAIGGTDEIVSESCNIDAILASQDVDVEDCTF